MNDDGQWTDNKPMLQRKNNGVTEAHKLTQTDIPRRQSCRRHANYRSYKQESAPTPAPRYDDYNDEIIIWQ